MLIPAILTDSVSDLQKKLQRIAGLSSWIHLDVMDGIFVPTESNVLMDLEYPRTYKVEAHLMVVDPVQYVQTCAYVKIERVIIHQEITRDFLQIVELFKEKGISVGVALNPQTDVVTLREIISHVDKVLLMSVNPGRQGQEFISSVLQKVSQVRLLRSDILIGMDGGINEKNMEAVVSVGVEDVTVGSGLFGARDIQKQWELLQSKMG